MPLWYNIRPSPANSGYPRRVRPAAGTRSHAPPGRITHRGWWNGGGLAGCPALTDVQRIPPVGDGVLSHKFD